ncbi:signal peptidase II [Bifidobacterium xylocopae]|uniref:Lipoprotein signal peptidase n=1 Tax=Bifidobacterium xylocopae TaxID=2493119 RepID=A0A366KBY3_9BIFI|nr:lipoprotein signal peptidase [Bifidobacterium xylocopae]
MGVDQAAKALALAKLSAIQPVSIIPGFLSLRLLRNPGASLGMGAGATWVISLLAVFACLAFVLLALATDSMSWTLAFALAFAGAAGNLIDRIVYAQGFLDGEVVDFLDYGWSVGNIADLYLALAAAAVIVMVVVGWPFRRSGAAAARQGEGER